MRAYAFAIIIGVITFIVVVVIALLVMSYLRKRKKRPALKTSFQRADAHKIKDEDRFRRSGNIAFNRGPDSKSRFYAFGAVIAVVFGTLAVRLWTLQVLSSSQYLDEANKNMTSEVTIPGVRGRILDRNQVELVTNRASIILSGKKAIADSRGLVHRLSLLLGVPKGVVRRNLLDDTAGVQADHVIATDVPMRVVAFIKEHPTLFQGVNIEQRIIRYYPFGALGAHILGYTGPITETELATLGTQDDFQYESGDTVGKNGAEFEFESQLRGTRGVRTYLVDSAGTPTELIKEDAPTVGSDVCLTMDARIQRETDRIILASITAAKGAGYQNASAGAIVCIDIKEGGILAASSYPTFNPTDLSGGISNDLWNQLNSEAAGNPLLNRALSGGYPAASTFKAFTSMTGLQHGVIQDDTEFYCAGLWDYWGKQWAKECWIYPGAHGSLPLEEAINQSCDSYFYNVGAAFFEQWDALPGPDVSKENVFQDGLKTWGFGNLTGIDLPNEYQGRVPDAAWKADWFKDTPEEAVWLGGNMADLCIGQGDLLVTPLQIANGYATLARKGAIKPHVFYKTIDNKGNTIVSAEQVPSDYQPDIDDKNHGRVLNGLERMIRRVGVFDVLPVTLAGKSGTAEVAGKDPYAWFVAFGPVEDPQYCVSCVIEEGGEGSVSAILGVLHTFAAIYNQDIGDYVTLAKTSER